MILDIALPFHGDVELFKDSARSVLSQTSPHWRLLIINDAHPDLEVDQWISAQADPRIRYIRNDVNLGPSLNYSKCVAEVTGEYCLIFGADDLLEPSYVEEITSAIKLDRKSDFFHPLVKVIDHEGEEYLPLVDRIKKWLTPSNDSTQILDAKSSLPGLMTGNWMYFPAITWKVDSLKKHGFRKDLNVCQDIWLISQILIGGGQAHLVHKILFKYRRFSGSDSSVKLLTGVRFAEEKEVFISLAREFKSRHLFLASISAYAHLASRLHAAALIPSALMQRKSLAPCLKHVLT